MKRRGFFGLMAGAAAAGPSMIKEAVAATTADMRIPGVGLQTIYEGMNGPIGGSSVGGDGAMWAVKELAKLTTMGAEALAKKRRATGVDMLDPDLAVMRSLTAKMSMQRDRNFERQFENEKHWLRRQIEEAAGL